MTIFELSHDNLFDLFRMARHAQKYLKNNHKMIGTH